MKSPVAWLAALVVALSLTSAAYAAIDLLEFDDRGQEERYNDLIKELRCLVCQNQNLADSDADLAKDLRTKAYEMIREGRSDQDIVDYMVERYGDFVLYRPPVRASTMLLWVGPFVILLVCLLVLVRIARRRRSESPPAEPDEAQREMARRLLQQDAGKDE